MNLAQVSDNLAGRHCCPTSPQPSIGMLTKGEKELGSGPTSF